MNPLRAVLFAVVAGIGLLVQGALETITPPAWPVPEWALCILLYIGLSRRGTVTSLVVFALVVGYVTDLVAGAPKGLHSLTFSAVVVASNALARQLLVTAGVQVFVVALLATLVHGWLVVFTIASVSGASAQLEGWVLPTIPVALVTAVVAVPVFAMCRRFDRRFQVETSQLRAGW